MGKTRTLLNYYFAWIEKQNQFSETFFFIKEVQSGHVLKLEVKGCSQLIVRTKKKVDDKIKVWCSGNAVE